MSQIFYVGIDVSKDKLDVALTSDGSSIISNAIFGNNQTGFTKLSSWVKKYSKKFEKVHYCLEATGIYSEDIAEFLQDKDDCIVSVMNPYYVKSYATSRYSRTKNDKVDAQILAYYAAERKPKKSVKVPPELKKFKQYVRHLSFLIDECARLKTKMDSIKEEGIKNSTLRAIAFFEQEIKETETKIKEQVDAFVLLKSKINLVDSIPGIGFRTSCIIIAEIDWLNKENLSAKSIAAYAGLDPCEKQSGKKTGNSRTSKRGNSNIRGGLFMPSLCAIQHNPILKDFYQRLINNRKLEMVALTAVMRKILTIAIGILRNDAPWDQNWALKKQLNFAKAN
jgi:transposase